MRKFPYRRADWRVADVLLNPLKVIGILFGAQFLVWYLVMPEDPLVEGIAPRYQSSNSLLLYLCFFSILLLGVYLGQSQILFPSRRRRIDQSPSVLSLHSQILNLKTIAHWGMALALFGEVIYIREVLLNPGLIAEAMMDGDFAAAGATVQSSLISGVTSLTNIYIVPACIWALLMFHPSVAPKEKKVARLWLVTIGIWFMAHSLILSARVYFLYFATAIVGANLLVNYGESRSRNRKLIAAIVVFSLLVIWCGAVLRDSGRYIRGSDMGLLDSEAQFYASLVLLQGYLGTDLNNCFTILDCDPPVQFFYTTMFSRDVLGENALPYYVCPNYTSSFGTMNALGLWWFDMGWLAIPLALITGFWLGFVYRLAKKNADRPGLSAVFFLISYVGIPAMLRMNYFVNTIFIFPFIFLLSSALFFRVKMTMSHG